MRGLSRTLLNTAEIELWPGGLLRARSNADARVLSRAQTVLRRKRDGRYLAAQLPDGLMPLAPRLLREPGIRAALERLAGPSGPSGKGIERVRELPLGRLHERLEALGLDGGYGERSGLPLVPEPDWLMLAGLDRYRRALWLHPQAARAWTHMREAAMGEGIVLEVISGYRSHAYQLGIFDRKRAGGLNVDDILAVNAAPGYSEHHSGRALDVGASTGGFADAGEVAVAFDEAGDGEHAVEVRPLGTCGMSEAAVLSITSTRWSGAQSLTRTRL